MAGKGGASRAARLSRRPPCFYNKKMSKNDRHYTGWVVESVHLLINWARSSPGMVFGLQEFSVGQVS